MLDKSCDSQWCVSTRLHRFLTYAPRIRLEGDHAVSFLSSRLKGGGEENLWSAEEDLETLGTRHADIDSATVCYEPKLSTTLFGQDKVIYGHSGARSSGIKTKENRQIVVIALPTNLESQITHRYSANNFLGFVALHRIHCVNLDSVNLFVFPEIRLARFPQRLSKQG